MSIDESVLKKIIKNISGKNQSFKQINIYSANALILLRYLDLLNPKFSKAGAAAQILVMAVKKKFPKLWEATGLFDLPEHQLSGSYLPATFPVINDKLWNKAIKEAKGREGRLITIYNQRVSAVFRYNREVTPRFAMSSAAANMIEQGLKQKYPETWERLIKDVKPAAAIP